MTALSILQMFGLSITKARINLLATILEVNTPVTLAILLQKNMGYNRITIHRTLKVFAKKGILHIIPSPDNRIFYKIKVTLVKAELHTVQSNFICNNCRASLRLEPSQSVQIDLPPGFTMKSMEIVVKGKCADCG